MSDDPYAPPKVDLEMRPERDAPALDVSIDCLSCKGPIRVGDKRCAGCRTPVSRNDKRILRERWAASSREVGRAAEETYWGRVAIAAAAGGATLRAIVYGLYEQGSNAAWNAGLAVLLAACFVLGLRAPLAACVLALLLSGLAWLVQLVVTPIDAMHGLWARLAIVLALIGGISAELRMRRRERALIAQRKRAPSVES